MFVVSPLHNVSSLAVASGKGFTVANTPTGVPLQLPAVGVIVYVAVPTVGPVVLNVSLMLVPLPAVAPLTPLCTTVQAKVVPATLFGLLIVIPAFCPLQIVCGEGVAWTVGTGSTMAFTS
jgi:hypothetical protein